MIGSPSICDEQFLADAVDGLRRSPKRIPAKYFYDRAGAALFERITELDEYYPTRSEREITQRYSAEIAKCCGEQCLLIEFGAGNLSKIRWLLDRLDQPAGYVPVDVSEEQLSGAAAELASEYPDLDVVPVNADFTQDFAVPEIAAARRVVYFPGSTLGNFDPAEVEALLRRIARRVRPGGGFLLGVDLRKDTAVVEAAYNDRLGVTAAFNRNLLERMNSELDADFNLNRFRHRAFYNPGQSRIEMHLVSTVDQMVHLGGERFPFRRGESIHTENSYKFDLSELKATAARCGFRADARWLDSRGYFAVAYFTAMSR